MSSANAIASAIIGGLIVICIAVGLAQNHRAQVASQAYLLEQRADVAALTLLEANANPSVNTTWTQANDPQLGTISYKIAAVTASSITVVAQANGLTATGEARSR